MTMRNKTLQRFWRRRITEPFVDFLTQGLSNQKLALSLAFGITLGTFPVLGITTLLCLLAALTLKLNLPVIQFANFLVYPLQILLLVPYYYLGNLLFNAQKHLDFDTLNNILAEITNKKAINMLLESTFYAIGAWLLISPLVLVLLYTGLKPALVKLNSESSRFKLFRR
ncbi:MAG: DUF2062 domain-containing protein [Desulfobacterales bacterium]|nr:MAG: DUF2062 domain-containing protein [Desulfobacterales bacterium]